MSSHAAEYVEVLVNDPVRLYELLDDAEVLLRRAPQQFAGILVTRHDPGRYSLTLSDTVPFGETRELVLS
jgi:hypothetical protein